MKEKISNSLREIKKRLDTADSLDPLEREKIDLVLKEIHQRLLLEDGKIAGLTRHLHVSTEQISESHPHLVKMIGQLADLLSQIGI